MLQSCVVCNWWITTWVYMATKYSNSTIYSSKTHTIFLFHGIIMSIANNCILVGLILTYNIQHKDYVGGLDGTHIHASVLASEVATSQGKNLTHYRHPHSYRFWQSFHFCSCWLRKISTWFFSSSWCTKKTQWTKSP